MVQVKTPRKPSFKEIARGTPAYDCYYVKTASNVKNARIVTRDTTDAQIKVAGDECKCPLGWVAREKTNSTVALSERTTDYTAGQYIGVVKGDITVVGYTAESAFTKGDLLVCAANGGVKLWNSDDERYVVGRAAETISSSGELLIESNLR